MEAGETIKDGIKAEKKGKVYSGIKKGTIVHSRSLNMNIKVDSDSTGTCCQVGAATDTIGKK